MTKIRKIDDHAILKNLKESYIEETTAPLDGMWLCGFVPMAKHFGIYEKEEIKGYFCINEEGYLLQYIPHFRQSNEKTFSFFNRVVC